MNFEYEIQGAATFLVYQKQEAEQIDSMSLGMISNNKIDGIVPFVYVQQDDIVCLKYNVSARNTLKQYFSGVVNKKRFLGVLNSLLGAFILSEEYMLEPSTFVLDSSYIFVNPNTSETSLIILPIIRDAEISIENFMRNLVFGIQFDQTEDCSYIAALISFLNANQFFSVHDFKQLIEKLLKETNQTAETEKKSYVSAFPEKPNTTMIQPSLPKSMPDTQAAFTPVEKQTPAKPVEEPEVKAVWNPIPEDKPEKRGLFGRGKEKEKKEKKPFFGKKERPSKKKSGKGSFGGMAIPGIDVPGMPEIPSQTESAVEIPNHSDTPHSSVPVQNVPMQQHMVEIQNFGETVDLRSYSEGTTVLTGTTVLVEPKQVSPYLLNVKTRERFVIVKELSRIGKDPMSNDFCVKGNSAVSRGHAAIYFRNGQVTVMDNRSTNGTFVDGVRLQPDVMSEALLHGSRVRLGDEELEFRMHE